MADLTTYTVYISLLLSLLILTNGNSHTYIKNTIHDSSQKLYFKHFIALILISIVVGFRYEVGVDWAGYKRGFEIIRDTPTLTMLDSYFEPAFFYVNKIVATMGLTYQWMFLTMALMTWFLFFKSLPTYILPLFIYFLFVDEFFFWGMNGIRQFLAIAFWVYSIKYIHRRELVKYLIAIFFAATFHKSSLILLPFYFIPYDKILKKNVWLSLFIVSFVIGTNSIVIGLIENASVWLESRFAFLNYSEYIGSKYLTIDNEVQAGSGYFFKIILNFLIIVVSGRVVQYLPETKIYFILFFIGAIIFNFGYNIQLINRFNGYFIIMRSVVLAYTVWVFWKNRKYRVAISLFCVLYFVLFLVAIHNSSNMCAPFRFVF